MNPQLLVFAPQQLHMPGEEGCYRFKGMYACRAAKGNAAANASYTAAHAYSAGAFAFLQLQILMRRLIMTFLFCSGSIPEAKCGRDEHINIGIDLNPCIGFVSGAWLPRLASDRGPLYFGSGLTCPLYLPLVLLAACRFLLSCGPSLLDAFQWLSNGSPRTR